MSSFSRVTKNPQTNEFERAEWLDDKFGLHKYGVYFPNTDTLYKDDRVWEFGNDSQVKRKVVKSGSD